MEENREGSYEADMLLGSLYERQGWRYHSDEDALFCYMYAFMYEPAGTMTSRWLIETGRLLSSGVLTDKPDVDSAVVYRYAFEDDCATSAEKAAAAYGLGLAAEGLGRPDRASEWYGTASSAGCSEAAARLEEVVKNPMCTEPGPAGEKKGSEPGDIEAVLDPGTSRRDVELAFGDRRRNIFDGDISGSMFHGIRFNNESEFFSKDYESADTEAIRPGSAAAYALDRIVETVRTSRGTGDSDSGSLGLDGCIELLMTGGNLLDKHHMGQISEYIADSGLECRTYCVYRHYPVLLISPPEQDGVKVGICIYDPRYDLRPKHVRAIAMNGGPKIVRVCYPLSEAAKRCMARRVCSHMRDAVFGGLGVTYVISTGPEGVESYLKAESKADP